MLNLTELHGESLRGEWVLLTFMPNSRVIVGVDPIGSDTVN